MLSFQLIGLEPILAKLKNAQDKRHYSEAMKETLEDAEFWAKTFTPVDTGELEESIRVEGDTLIADAPWAIFNEYGCYNIEVGTVQNPKASESTSGKFAYRPFLRPALLLAMQDFPERLFSKISATSTGLVSFRVGQRRG